MFKLTQLVLHGYKPDEIFTYTFSEGINYFIGKNDSGKTEFYTFIDYMLGESADLSRKEWYNNTLMSADLFIEKDGIIFTATRYLDDANHNFVQYSDDNTRESMRLDEYKERLNRILSPNDEILRNMRSFIGADLSYRTFTMFNFLGEKRQGVLNNFHDKANDIRYMVKQYSLLNYIFNKNIAEILQLQKDIANLQSQIKAHESNAAKNEEYKNKVNKQLEILGIGKVFNGKNGDAILLEVDSFQKMQLVPETDKQTRTISELEAVYTSLDEQIKVQSKIEQDCASFSSAAQNQKLLLEMLQSLLIKSPHYSYLVSPIVQLTDELSRSISFNKYLIQESTLSELKNKETVFETKFKPKNLNIEFIHHQIKPKQLS